MLLHRSMSGQRTPALGGPWLPAAWMQDSSAGGGVFLPCKFSNSLVSASPRMPWAPCSACQGHSRFPAVNAAFPGWQMFLCLCLSTHCLSVLFPIVIRSPSGLLLQQGVSGVPLVPAARSCPGSGSDPQELHVLCWTLGKLRACPHSSPCV